MAANSVLVFVSVLLGVTQFFNHNCVGGSPFDRPQIASENEYILTAFDNHTIYCQGNQPLTWSVPEIDEEQREEYLSSTTFETVPEKPINTKFTYGLRLYITNITYQYVGYYYCHHQNAEKDSETESAKIYLYVNDTDHLSVLSSAYVNVFQDEVAVIPCRPTSPDISVSLTGMDLVDVEDATYDPKTGYSFFVYDISQQNTYMCNFARAKQQFEMIIALTVTPGIPTSHLNVPVLTEESGGHTVVGDPLSLTCSIRTANKVFFEWTFPRGSMKGVTNSSNTYTDSAQQTLTIEKTSLKDNGLYVCRIWDRQNHEVQVNATIKIFDVNENFVEIWEPNGVNHTTTYAGQASIQWVVDVDGHPPPTVRWLDRTMHSIPNGAGEKYETDYNPTTKKALLKIKNIEIHDFGTYTVVADNGIRSKNLTFFLNVTDKPTVHIDVKPFNLLGAIESVRCMAAAYPRPNFNWEYKNCLDDSCDYIQINYDDDDTKAEGLLFTSEVQIKANKSGLVRCTATNVNGSADAVSGFFVSDVQNGFDIFGFDDTVVLDGDKHTAIYARGETISMICGVANQNYSSIDWLFNDNEIFNDDRHTIEVSRTAYSERKTLVIHHANSSNIGRYECRTLLDGRNVSKKLFVSVKAPVPPRINETNMLSNSVEMNFPDNLTLVCRVNGIPKPTIIWEKNSAPFNPTDKRIQILDDKEVIWFTKTDPVDQGTYKCLGKNKLGVVSAHTSLKFKNLPGSQTWLIAIIAMLGALFLAALIFIIYKTRRERHLRRELKKLGLMNFEKGAVENINPELGIDDQAELLPYDKKWEFPIEHLKLGKQLGSGAFGVVLKGVAKNIVDGEESTVVAVKMVKKNADNTYIRALASELKIMVHLGKHLNVVNLLGACTKNVAKRELLVIVEYCRFGNLQNYLLRHRENFVNQVDPKTGRIDYCIGQEYLNRSFSVSSGHSTCQTPSAKITSLKFPNSNENPVVPAQSSMGDYRATDSGQYSVNTATTAVVTGDNGVMLSNNSVQPEWRSNYRGDYKGNVKPISTKDLMAWSFQVARGMDYLASRKVLHGDLAARNILLSDNDVVKICDFGLAKSMYKNDNYKKRGNCPLPLKWMAIESISDRVFSTQSDVWSFGIVLWEFFSLGRTPYPGMEADERLYHKLVEGYRMDAPPYAPKAIFEMMSHCWQSSPLNRPNFEQLTERLGNLLEESLRKHYIDLNDPYLAMNTRNFEETHNDYLAMVSPPTFEALSSPRYENDIMIDQGYMSMNKNTDIFSPRATDIEEPVFDFSSGNRKHLSSEEGHGTELLPILHTTCESDGETPMHSPNSVANPTYHRLPSVREDDKGGIVQSTDNYVNMPQNKHVIKDKTQHPNWNQSNGTADTKVPEPYYVNADSRKWDSVKV